MRLYLIECLLLRAA